jgi:hypothetical protein
MADPARVAAAIDGVAGELQRWANAAGQGAEEAQYVHRGAVEEAINADRLAALASHHALELHDGVERAQDVAHEAVTHARDANEAVAYRVDAVDHASGFAGAMLTAWQGELQAALAWLERARERVRQAELWVARARAEVAAAKSFLSRAESALGACKRDPDRRSCNAEANDVNRARALLAAALADLQRAENELRLAIEERTRAERRVASCHGAVDAANAADVVVEQAMTEAVEARHLAALARDHGAGAVANAQRAADAAAAQRAAADNVSRFAGQANDELSRAAVHLQAAEDGYADARRLAFDAAAEMTQAIRRLKVFDQASGL